MGCFPSKSRRPNSAWSIPPFPCRTPSAKTRENTKEFNSDTSSSSVDIKYDDRKDEVEIPVQEDNDPAPFPAHPDNNNIKVPNHFFDDADFQLSSEEWDTRSLDDVEEDTKLLGDGIQTKNSSPIPELTRKQIPALSFAAIDEHARTAEEIHSKTFASLIHYLTCDLSTDHKEILTARAIIIWLSQQNVEKSGSGEPSLDSPKGLIKTLGLERITYATCYTILCRQAGLRCTKIRGLVKAAGYEPGHSHAGTSSWTAVFADGAWRIVNPFWVCKALFGSSLAGWVKIEEGGKSMAQRTQGVVWNAFQDYYFMPKPEHYVHVCFPNDTSWELLPKSLMINTEEDFFKMPYLFPPFFGLGLDLTSEPKCHLQTTNGTCKIQIKAKESNGHMIVLNYKLFVKEATNFDESNCERMVFNSRSNEYFTFDMRFPTQGVFKFVIYGGPHKSPLLRLCEFKITCDEHIAGINLLPLSDGLIGYGPGPATADAGLYMPSRPNGRVFVPKCTKRTDIKFSIKKEFIDTSTFAAYLVDGKDEDTGELGNYVQTNVIHENLSLIIAVSLPRAGEYGLRITSRTTVSRTVCNYLLSTDLHEKANITNAKAKLRNAVAHLETVSNAANWEKELKECRRHLDQCIKEKVDPSDEDFCIAKRTIELYRYKIRLRDSINRRNLKVIHLVLQYTKKFQNKMAIAEDIVKVENFREKLIALRELSLKANAFEEAFTFLSSDTLPKNEVLKVYKAVLCLKGTSPRNLKTWSQITMKMGNSESILDFLSNIHESDIPEVHRKWVKTELGDAEMEESIRSINEQLYSLYKWLKAVLGIYDSFAKERKH